MENDNLSGQLKKHFIDNQLPIYLKKFDNIVKQNNGHFVLGEVIINYAYNIIYTVYEIYSHARYFFI